MPKMKRGPMTPGEAVRIAKEVIQIPEIAALIAKILGEQASKKPTVLDERYPGGGSARIIPPGSRVIVSARSPAKIKR